MRFKRNRGERPDRSLTLFRWSVSSDLWLPTSDFGWRRGRRGRRGRTNRGCGAGGRAV